MIHQCCLHCEGSFTVGLHCLKTMTLRDELTMLSAPPLIRSSYLMPTSGVNMGAV